jgi:hypothetical protein
MKAPVKVLIVMAAALVAGCNGEVEPQAEVDAKERESVFDPMTDQIDKAKKVEAQTLQHKDDIDKALEDSEGEK